MSKPKTYIVKAVIRTVETWEVSAHDEAHAIRTFENGMLMKTEAYELERIESVNLAAP